MANFRAAEANAYNMSWNVLAEMSPDRELRDYNTLKTLRTRSHQMIKDNVIVAGVQQAYINTIGSPEVIKLDSDNNIQRKQANNLLEETLTSIDITGKSFYKIIEEIVAWSFASGDILINLPLDNKREGIRTTVELIEASRIETPKEYSNDKYVSHGVKYDADGRVVGYYVKKYESMDSYFGVKDDYDFYPRYKTVNGLTREVTRLFKAPLNSRPKMSRQYPIITPAIHLFKLLDDYVEAVIVGARVAACFAGFVTSDNPAGAYKAFTTDANGEVLDPVDENEERKVHKLQPGMISYLKPNQKIEFASPNRPNDNVDAFIVRIYKTIAMYLRIPYPILFLDLVDVNYSSWRGGANEFKKTVNRWRYDLGEIINWVIKTILLEALSKEMIRGTLDSLKVKVRWPVHGILDPEKEARSNKYRIANKTASPQLICDEEGLDYEAIQQELFEEKMQAVEEEAQILLRKKELESELGIMFPTTVEQEKTTDQTNSDEQKDTRKDDGNW